MPRKKGPATPPRKRVDWPPTGKVEITQTFITRAREEQRPGVPAVDVRDTLGTGLLLRVSPRTISWGWKAERFGQTQRLDLGPVGGMTVTQARAIATAATTLLRSNEGLPTVHWLTRKRVEMGLLTKEEAYPDAVLMRDLAPPKPRGWTYTQAVDAYLAAHQAGWRKGAYDDARKNLRHPILRRFAPLPVATVTADDLAEVLAAKNATHHRQAEAIYVRVRHFYEWLASAGPRRDSGVPKGHLDDLSRPQPPASKEGDEPRTRVRFPAMDSCGLLLALARTDLLRDQLAAAVILLLATVQRRHAIATARVSEFSAIADEPGWGRWTMPPIRRKTGDKAARKGSEQRHHALPLPPPVWDAVQAQVERAGDTGWLFPGMRPRRAGAPVSHLSEATLTHLLQALPVDASPHDLRRAFRSHGRKVLKMVPRDLDLILDHTEGVAAGSVSEAHYVDDDRMDLKVPVMRAWWDLVERHAGEARFDLEAVRDGFLAAKARQKGRPVKPPASAAAAVRG